MVLLAGLVLVLGPGGVFACLASDDAGTRVVQSPSAVEVGIVEARDADWWLPGPAKSSGYGQSVASAGNVDGHNGDDILVGAPKYGTDQGEGTVFLYLSTGGDVADIPIWEASPGMGGALFGSSVAGAGDVDADGYDDAIIGAPDYKTVLMTNDGFKEVKAGGAFVYLGDPGLGLESDPIWSYAGEVQDGKFGDVVGGAGDVNGGGVDDVVVGARWYTDQPDTDPNKHSGAIYVFYGHEVSGPSEDPDWFISCPQAGAWFGASVSAAGDVNHDGYSDLLVGAPGYLNPDTGLPEGAALLFLGGDTPPDDVGDAAWIAYGGQEDSDFGTAVARAGDVNGDGHPDVVVSAPGYRRPSDDALVGAVFAYCGNGAEFGTEPCWMVTGGQPGAQFGASVAGAGDVNGDGFDELIVGAPAYQWNPDNGFEGLVSIYFGSEVGLSAWAGWKAGGDKSETRFGESVDLTGPVVGDTASVIVGAPRYFDVTDPYGAAFLFYGPLEPGGLYRAYLPLVMSNAN